MQVMYDDDGMNDTTPVTVYLPTDRVAQIQKVVDEGRAESFSAWVTEAVEVKAKQGNLDATETLGDVMDDILMRTGGPVTEEERREWARLDSRR